PIAGTEKSRAQHSSEIAITRSFPMQLKRRGVELRLIVGDHNRSAATVDLPLLKAIARAHSWFDELSSGEAKLFCRDRCPRGARRALRRPLDPLGLSWRRISLSQLWRAGSRPVLLQKHSPGTSRCRSNGAPKEPL